MCKFIYAEESMRNKLLSLGYKEINNCRFNKKQYYIFVNNEEKPIQMNFSSEDKTRLMFTDKLFF